MRKEKDLQNSLKKYLERFFFVQEEVWDVEQKSRIDLVMVHKTDIQKAYPIGVEKKVDEKKRWMDLAKWLLQAIKYSNCSFSGYGKVLVITAPPITGKYLNEGDLMSKHPPYTDGMKSYHNNVNTFLGGFEIGELQRYHYIANGRGWDKNVTGDYFRIVYKASMIWDSANNEFRTDNLDRLWK